jgi:hypothetical protein
MRGGGGRDEKCIQIFSWKITMEGTTWQIYEVWLLTYRNDIIASLISVYLQLTERGHIQSTPLEQLCPSPTDAATIGKIFGTPVVEYV